MDEATISYISELARKISEHSGDRLTVVSFTGESACSFSGGISRTGHMGCLSTQYARSSRLQRVYRYQLSLTDPRDGIVLQTEL